MTEAQSRVFTCRAARVLVVLPTVNERQSLPRVIDALLSAVPDGEVLVVDDVSLGAAGTWAKERAACELPLPVLQRGCERGFDSAYKAGFAWGIERGFGVFAGMDGDGSHCPVALRALLETMDDGADLTIGSRYIEGVETRNWPVRRQLLSRLSNALTRRLLRLPAHDVTAGVRAWRAQLLETIDLGRVESDDYEFLVETLWRAVRAGARIVERRSVFVERRDGTSKMSGREIRQAAFTLFRLRCLDHTSASLAGRTAEQPA